MYEPKTFEELLMGQLNKAIEAMNAENSNLFDGIMESIEILLKIVPQMYNDYIKEKEILYQKAMENFKLTEQKTAQYQDELYREFAKSRQDSIISWAFRKDIFEVLVSLMSKYNKIAFTNQEFASFNQVPIVQQVHQPIQQQVQQPPQQVQQLQQPQQSQQPQQQPQPPDVIQEQPKEGKITEEQLRQMLLQNKSSKQKQSKYTGLLFGRK